MATRQDRQLSQTETETACKRMKKSGRDRKCNVDHLASSTKSHFVQRKISKDTTRNTLLVILANIFHPTQKHIIFGGWVAEVDEKFPFEA